MKIENWQKYQDRICGEVYSNPRFEDGTFIYTSPIKELKENEVITINSTYQLGKELKNGRV